MVCGGGQLMQQDQFEGTVSMPVGHGHQAAAAIESISSSVTQSVCLFGHQASSISARILRLRHSQKADKANKSTAQLTG